MNGRVLVQVTKRRGKIMRVRPEHAPPTVQLEVYEHERVISMDLRQDEPSWRSERVTYDWSWTAYIESRLEITP